MNKSTWLGKQQLKYATFAYAFCKDLRLLLLFYLVCVLLLFTLSQYATCYCYWLLYKRARYFSIYYHLGMIFYYVTFAV
jgi:hypothetical protein